MKYPHNWELPDEIDKRFGTRTAGKQRAMVAEGNLLLILHRVPKPDERRRDVVFFWRKPDGTWETSEKGRGLPSLQQHVQSFIDAEEELDKEYLKAEKALDYFNIMERLAPIQRSAHNLLDTLQAAREAIKDDRDIISLRDDAASVSRNLELLNTDTQSAIDYDIAKKAEEQAVIGEQSVKATNRLNFIAAICLPLTAISGAFGMNLPIGLEKAPVALFWCVLLSGIILGIILSSWAFTKPK